MKYRCNLCSWRGPDTHLLTGPASIECPQCGSVNLARAQTRIY